MKLHLDTRDGRNSVTGYGAGYVLVNGNRRETGFVIMADRIVEPWVPGGFDTLTEADIAAVLALEPEIVLIGTGARQRFPAPALMRPLIAARIGYEVMDLQAACRTYNILMAENRKVAAALMFL